MTPVPQNGPYTGLFFQYADADPMLQVRFKGKGGNPAQTSHGPLPANCYIYYVVIQDGFEGS